MCTRMKKMMSKEENQLLNEIVWNKNTIILDKQ